MTLPVWGARALSAYPHDTGAFTQGLFWRDGFLWESTGGFGESTVRKVTLETGRVILSAPLPDEMFGEGIAPAGDDVVGVTWRNGVGFRWEAATLRLKSRFVFAGEGWGLASDGARLILSDGTPVIRFLDPDRFVEERRIAVTAEGRPLAGLNALQWVEGEIFANILGWPVVARIDPADGRVGAFIDLRALVPEAARGNPQRVANGIAWDRSGRRLFVTGKNWPQLFEIALIPPR